MKKYIKYFVVVAIFCFLNVTKVFANTTIMITKENMRGEDLTGAKLILTGKDSYGNDIEFTDVSSIGHSNATIDIYNDRIEIITGGDLIMLDGLPDGDYSINEVVAPQTYESLGEPYTFKIVDGVVLDHEKNTIRILNDLIDKEVDLRIQKEDENKNPLKGAKLEINVKDKNGDDVNINLNDISLGREASVEYGNNGNIILTTGSTLTIINKVKDGLVTIKELEAPVGYKKNTETMTFNISNGKVTACTGVRCSDEFIYITNVKEETTTQEEPTQPTTPDEPKTSNETKKEEVKNPNTSDKVATMISIFVSSLLLGIGSMSMYNITKKEI